MSKLENLKKITDLLLSSNKHINLSDEDSDDEHFVFLDIASGTQYGIDYKEVSLQVLYFNELNLDVSEDDLIKYLTLFEETFVANNEIEISESISKVKPIKYDL